MKELDVKFPANSMRHAKGFTIIEVMVSVIIFSIGLIGIAKLQVVSKQSNYDAVARITATGLAQDMLSRMRANPGELLAYVTVSGINTVGRTSITTEPTPNCSSTASGDICGAEELADHDVWEFEQALDGAAEQDANGNSLGGLSQPTACISGPVDGSAGVYTVAIVWYGKTPLSNPAANACGENTGLYGTNNEFRRLLVVETFIDDA